MNCEILGEDDFDSWVESFYQDLSQETFDALHDAVFTALSAKFIMRNSGSSEPADLAMSRYVDPVNVVTVVTLSENLDFPNALRVAQAALKTLPADSGILFDDHPLYAFVTASTIWAAGPAARIATAGLKARGT